MRSCRAAHPNTIWCVVGPGGWRREGWREELNKSTTGQSSACRPCVGAVRPILTPSGALQRRGGGMHVTQMNNMESAFKLGTTVSLYDNAAVHSNTAVRHVCHSV